jgi:hypothetical protein
MVSAVRQIARHEIAQQLAPVLGVVSSVFHTDYTCTVALRESGVVLPHVPIATGLTGAAGLPRENDLVVVAFLGGDAHAPVVLGRLYNEQVAPPDNAPGRFVASLPGDADAGDALVFDVKTPDDGSHTVTLTLNGGDVTVKLTIDDTGFVFEAPKAKLTLTGGDDAAAELAVDSAKVTISSSGDVTVTSSGKLTLKGDQVEISADSSLKIGGQTVDIN